MSTDPKPKQPYLIYSIVLVLFIALFSSVLIVNQVEFSAITHRNEAIQQEGLQRLENEMKKLENHPSSETVEIDENDVPPDFDSIAHVQAKTPRKSPGLFICYNSADYDEVQKLVAEFSKRKQFVIWFAEEQLRPGQPSLISVENAICQNHSVAFLVGRSGLGRWQKTEIAMAKHLAATDPSRVVIPVLLPDAVNDEAIPLFLRTRTYIDLREESTKDAADLMVWGVTNEKVAK